MKNIESRPIKFRIWGKRSKRFINIDDDEFAIRIDGTILSIEHRTGSGDVYRDSEGEFFEAQQFTGLQDKNGQKIYEGDIIKFSVKVETEKFELFVCEYDDSQACYIFYKNGKKDILGGYCFSQNESKSLQIIGNIFENSELLK